MNKLSLNATNSLFTVVTLMLTGCECTEWAHQPEQCRPAPQVHCPPSQVPCEPTPTACESPAPTVSMTETTLGLQMSQMLDLREVEIDYDELKRIMAIKEATSRAEALRLQRQPALQQEQRQAIPNMPFNSAPNLVPGVPQTSYGRVPGYFASQERQLNEAQMNQIPQDADIVVAIDEFGNAVPQRVPKPRLQPFEIPYVLKMRLNLNMTNGSPQSVRTRNVICAPEPERPPQRANCCPPNRPDCCVPPQWPACAAPQGPQNYCPTSHSAVGGSPNVSAETQVPVRATGLITPRTTKESAKPRPTATRHGFLSL